MHITNIKNMLAGTLNLEPPWKIEGAEFDTERKQLHIYVDIDEKAELHCPHCGGVAKRYGYEPKERIWRHADCFFLRMFRSLPTSKNHLLQLRCPSVECPIRTQEQSFYSDVRWLCGDATPRSATGSSR